MTDSIKDSILAKFQQINQDKEVSGVEPLAQSREPYRRRKPHFRRRHDFKARNRFVRSENVSLLESDVGITEYVTTDTAITGIIKHRFSDFQVHEIDPEGKVVVFDSNAIPKNPEPDATNAEEDDRAVLTDEQWKKLEELLNSGAKKDKMFIDVSDMDKAQRSKVHKAIKKAYGAKVCSNSIKDGEKMQIQVGISSGKNNERLSWPPGQGRFLHFTVYKENTDTAFLTEMLSRHTKCKVNAISFAGTKDKRGKTTQRMCIKNKRAEQVASTRTYGKAHFGNFSYEHKPLRLGDLSGNKFTLAIRSVTADDETINNTLNSIGLFGFINYFGLQRFGTSSAMPTHIIGKMMLLENWEEAVNAILKPKVNSAPPLQEACEIWSASKDASSALHCLEGNTGSIEGRLLSALKKQSNNFYDALFAIPRNSLLLYLHAYQSFVWNKVVSRRIREFGFKTLPGDLVIDNSQESEAGTGKGEAAPGKGDGKASENMEVDEKEDQENEGEEEEEEQTSGAPEADSRIKKVKKLTEPEVNNTVFTNVVYPLPGNDVEFPDNAVKDFYTEIMKEDGITMDHFVNSKKVFSLFGTYRKVIARPENMTFSIVKYDNPDEDLIVSDLDEMRGKMALDNNKNGKNKAVILDFSLEPCVYATMFLREVTKNETSASFHAKLSEEAHVKDAPDSGESESKSAENDCEPEKNDGEPPEKLTKIDPVVEKPVENDVPADSAV